MSTFIKTGYWEVVKDRKKGWLDLEALILKVTGGGGGGSTLQSVLENGNTAENITLDMVDGAVRAFAASDPNSRHTIVNSEGISVFDTNTQIELELNKNTPGVVTYKFDETKTSGTFTLATLDDIPSGGNQDLQSVLNNGNFATSNLQINNFNGSDNIVLSNNTYMSLNDNTNQIYSNLYPSYLSFSAYTGSTTTANFVGTWKLGVNGLGFDGIIRGTSGNSVTANFNYPRISTNLNTTLPISVNGNYADVNGNITVSGGSSPIEVVNTNSLFSVTPLAGVGITTLDSSIFFGDNAGSNATAANGSNFLGRGAGREATNASEANFFGFSAGFFALNAQGSNFIGNSAGSSATNASFSNFFGREAGKNASGANNSNFLGTGAGFNASSASNSNFLGQNAGKSFTSNDVGANNIIIGTNISLPNAATNSINIGGILFGINTYSTTTGDPSIIPATNGKIGIGVVTPTATLDIAASTTLQALMRLRVGVAPTAPNDGDVWLESNTITGLKIRLGGVTRTITIT
jgi:hypothetical protein